MALLDQIVQEANDLGLHYPDLFIFFFLRQEVERTFDSAHCCIFPNINGTFTLQFDTNEDPDFQGDFEDTANSIEDLIQRIPFDRIYDLEMSEYIIQTI